MNGIAYNATQSKTMGGGVLASILWALSNRYLGADIPVEVLMAVVGGIALKETASKLDRRPREG